MEPFKGSLAHCPGAAVWGLGLGDTYSAVVGKPETTHEKDGGLRKGERRFEEARFWFCFCYCLTV